MATKRALVHWLIAGSFALVSGCDRSRPEEISPETRLVATASNMFAVDLFQELRSTPGNMFLSPFSISTALAMTYAGAAGTTAEQMARVMHFSATAPPPHAAYEALIRGLDTGDNQSGDQLRIANRLWGQTGEDFKKPFREVTRRHYGAELEELNFVADPEGSRTKINSWVEERTNRKIVDLVPRGAIDKLTRLVLTNAIYFHGTWQAEFDSTDTRVAPFKLGDSVTVDASMMNKEDSLRYAKVDDFALLELPYSNTDLVMIVLLPDSTEGLPGLEQRLSAAQLDSCFAKLKRTKVRVSLPRFRMTTTYLLNDHLAALGMDAAFDPMRADFSNMNGKRDLFISLVVHKAFVDVSEKGTEAAAATAVVATRSIGMAPRSPRFIADHPFVFMIRDQRTSSILFLGRVTDPSRSGA
ncbi:MAG: serpin family protein [bacterium]